MALDSMTHDENAMPQVSANIQAHSDDPAKKMVLNELLTTETGDGDAAIEPISKKQRLVNNATAASRALQSHGYHVVMRGKQLIAHHGLMALRVSAASSKRMAKKAANQSKQVLVATGRSTKRLGESCRVGCSVVLKTSKKHANALGRRAMPVLNSSKKHVNTLVHRAMHAAIFGVSRIKGISHTLSVRKGAGIQQEAKAQPPATALEEVSVPVEAQLSQEREVIEAAPVDAPSELDQPMMEEMVVDAGPLMPEHHPLEQENDDAAEKVVDTLSEAMEENIPPEDVAPDAVPSVLEQPTDDAAEDPYFEEDLGGEDQAEVAEFDGSTPKDREEPGAEDINEAAPLQSLSEADEAEIEYEFDQLTNEESTNASPF